MREILFRGKRIDGKGWACGYFVENENAIYRAFIVSSARWDVDGDGCTDLLETEVHEVYAATVGQFTGLCDKNGKQIFEGDIVGFEDCVSTESGYAECGCTGCVFWDNKTESFQVDNRLSAESYEVLKECAIIGNIYDNPELIKDEHR